MIDSQADIIFTMLNAGRTGAIEACRERGAKQIGNVRDWVAAMPDVFIASAVADSGIAVLRAIEDFVRGTMVTNAVEKIGLARPDAVRLTMASTLSEDIRRQTRAMARELRVKGLMNVQFAVARDGTIYVLEVNPRASRTVPFVSKSIGMPLARYAALAMAGSRLSHRRIASCRSPRKATTASGSHSRLRRRRAAASRPQMSM